MINWGLGQGNNALQMFGIGAQMGQQFQDRRDQREDRNALISLRQKQEDRLTAESAATQQRQQQEQRRADLPVMERLLDFAKDEGTWQQALAAAPQYGIDVSEIPRNFDPAWRDQQLQMVRMMQTPRGQEALSSAGKQAVDAGFEPGTPEFTAAVKQLITADMAQPYMGERGETRLYTPDPFGGGGQVQGATPFNPDEWEVVEEGGPASQAPGGFRP